jgi:hypothetical protein
MNKCDSDLVKHKLLCCLSWQKNNHVVPSNLLKRLRDFLKLFVCQMFYCLKTSDGHFTPADIMIHQMFWDSRPFVHQMIHYHQMFVLTDHFKRSSELRVFPWWNQTPLLSLSGTRQVIKIGMFRSIRVDHTKFFKCLLKLFNDQCEDTHQPVHRSRWFTMVRFTFQKTSLTGEFREWCLIFSMKSETVCSELILISD